MATTGTRPRRRNTTEVRDALLDAAATVFARDGYSGATITEIAKLAKTPPVTAYRHFGTKEAIFTAAVVDPFLDFIADYTTEYEAVIAGSADPAKDYRAIFGLGVSSMYDHLEPRREAVLALIAALSDPQARVPVQDAIDRLNTMFDDFNQLSIDHWKRSGQAYDRDNTEIWGRLLTAMVIGTTALAPLLLPNHPGRDKVVDVITQMIRGGIR